MLPVVNWQRSSSIGTADEMRPDRIRVGAGRALSNGRPGVQNRHTEYIGATVPGVVVVRAASNRQGELMLAAERLGYQVTSSIEPLGIARLAVPPGQEHVAIQALERYDAVVWADVSHRERLTGVVPDDTYYPAFQSNLARIGMESAWSVTTGSPEVIVAVLDTGVDFSHPDLAGNLLDGYDFVNGDADPSDDSSHGTAVAGIIAAIGNNGVGIAGVAWQVKVLPVKVLDRQGQGSDDVVAQGIVYAVDQGARIINLSSSTVDESRVLRDAVTYADLAGVLVVAAAGNSGDRENLPNFPAAYPEVLAVAASDRSDKVPFFSQRQPYIGIAAPGTEIPSTAWVGAGLGPYALTTGTSAAAPHVSGVAALLLSVRPDLTNVELRKLLEDAAQDVCPAGRDDASGFGRLDAAAALASVSDGNPQTPPTPLPDSSNEPAPTLPELPTIPALLPPDSTPESVPPTTQSNVESAPTSWYFAEGSTQAPFETWLTLYNPGLRVADVRLTFMQSDADAIVQDVRLPPACRQNILVNDIVPNAELSIRVESSESVFAERSMYFGHDGTASIGATSPSRSWYLAEGSSVPPFDTWILLQNPSNRVASVRVSFMREDGEMVVQPLVMPAASRRSIYVNLLFQSSGFSTAVESDVPIVVERAMYFDGSQGGHGTIAVKEPKDVWYLAEGQTRGGFDTWLLIQNPNRVPTSVEITFYLEEGAPVIRRYQIGALARFTLYTNSILPNTAFGMRVAAEDPIVVERAVYFAQGRGGHVSAGLADPSREWFLPEGLTSGGFQETLAILNPDSRTADVTVVLTRGDGAPDVSLQLLIAPNSRSTIDVNQLLADAGVSAQVTSDREIVVERTLLFGNGLGGTNAPGIPR